MNLKEHHTSPDSTKIRPTHEQQHRDVVIIQLTFSAVERGSGAEVHPPPIPIRSSYLPADSRSDCSMTTFLRFLPLPPTSWP